jgi:thioredoxin-like negative regulator of GroEL
MLVLAAALAASAPPLVEREPPPIPWRASYRGGLEEAQRAKVPVLLYFSADWCEPCRNMEATTFRDTEFMAALAGVVPAKSPFYPDSGLARKFGVYAIPAMFLIDETGAPITHWTGYHPPERLAPVLQEACSGYAAYRTGLSAPGKFSDYRRVAAYLVKMGNTGRALEVLETGRKRIPKSDTRARELADLDIAEAHEVHGELDRAAELYSNLSMEGRDRDVRARALYRLSRVEIRRGRPKQAAEAKEKIARLYPDLDPSRESGSVSALPED